MSLYPAEQTRSAFPVSGALNEDRQTCSDAVFPEVDDFSQKNTSVPESIRLIVYVFLFLLLRVTWCHRTRNS